MESKLVDDFLKMIMTEKEYKEVGHLPAAKEMYTVYYILSVEVIQILDSRFIIKKEDMDKLPAHWMNTLTELAEKEDLVNPSYISIDEDGILLVD